MVQYGKRTLFYPERVFAIGDVHSEFQKLDDVLSQVEPLLTPGDHIVFAGDLHNRGFTPTQTIERLIKLVNDHPDQVHFVEGNHCWMLRNYLLTGSHHWMEFLAPTLNCLAYDWKLADIAPATISQALIDKGFKAVIDRTIPYYETDSLIVTHAPLDPTICAMNGILHYEDDYNDRINNPLFVHFLERMQFEIKWQFSDEKAKIPSIKKFLISAHQPDHKTPRIYRDRAFIDTGRGKGNKPLTCLIYPGKKWYQSR